MDGKTNLKPIETYQYITIRQLGFLQNCEDPGKYKAPLSNRLTLSVKVCHFSSPRHFHPQFLRWLETKEGRMRQKAKSNITIVL